MAQPPWDQGTAEMWVPREWMPIIKDASGRDVHGKGMSMGRNALERKSVGSNVSGKGFLCERVTLRRDVHGRGCPWEGMLLGKDGPRNGCPWDLGELGLHAPCITHHPLFQGRCYMSRIHRHTEDPTAPVLQSQALGEHVQSSLGGQIPLLTIMIWQCHGQWWRESQRR